MDSFEYGAVLLSMALVTACGTSVTVESGEKTEPPKPQTQITRDIIGDLNADGVPDLVFGVVEKTPNGGHDSIHIFFGPYDASRDLHDADVVLHAPGGAVAIGDVGDDGFDDLVVGDVVESAVYIFAGGPACAPKQTTDAIRTLTGGEGFGKSIHVVDDKIFIGAQDRVVVHPTGRTYRTKTWGGVVSAIATGDVNGDGDIEVFARVGSDGHLLGYLEHDALVFPDLAAIDIEDFNGDGIDDLVMHHYENHIDVYMGPNLHGSGVDVIELDASRAKSMTVADLTGNGTPDIVIGHPDGVLLWDGGTLESGAEPMTLISTDMSESEGFGHDVAIADLGNGTLDLLVSDFSTPDGYGPVMMFTSAQLDHQMRPQQADRVVAAADATTHRVRFAR